MGDVHAGEDESPLPPPQPTLDDNVVATVLEHLPPRHDAVLQAQQPSQSRVVHPDNDVRPYGTLPPGGVCVWIPARAVDAFRHQVPEGVQSASQGVST